MARPPKLADEWGRHVFRRYNSVADAGATAALRGAPVHPVEFSKAETARNIQRYNSGREIERRCVERIINSRKKFQEEYL